jgi:hypothetical protein
MKIKALDFEHIVQKFQLKTRNAGDRLAWFEYKGKLLRESGALTGGEISLSLIKSEPNLCSMRGNFVGRFNAISQKTTTQNPS